MARSKLTAQRYWYCSPRADAAIEAVFMADHRRIWDPRRDRPSLASLQGKAKKYGGHYVRSRSRLLDRAGVRVRPLYEHSAGKLVYIVTLPDEPFSAAIHIDRQARLLLSA